MSGTVNYPKVIDHLTDVIKEMNVPCGEAAPAAPSEETRRADAVDLVKALLSTLEQGGAGATDAAAEHSASSDKFPMDREPGFNLPSSLTFNLDFSKLFRQGWTLRPQ